jgi:hypothetical protein
LRPPRLCVEIEKIGIMKNPWETGAVCGGVKVAWVDAENRMRRVKEANAKKLKAMIKWPDTQKTVRLAAERRLRKLTAKR